ncbi:TipAS antibiotic-recognition domain-containing protein [Pedobacter steynii]|nr:TipAS antibiotic-recognition domain-containing protein [Pedobacter steynii]NQX38436.1 TipAS antibiotic-recognition domain-containing protein [Pedobacter steynii]
MLELNDLYDRPSKDEAAGYRNVVVKNYETKVVVVDHAEGYLGALTKRDFETLVARQRELSASFVELSAKLPSSAAVQALVHEHYLNTRRLWGTFSALDKQGETYKGLGKLYLTDWRFPLLGGKSDPVLWSFIAKAMAYYADHHLL